jgi:hypothetical protein
VNPAQSLSSSSVIGSGSSSFPENDERMHHYQRGRTSITG